MQPGSTEPAAIVIFGASGDLTQKKLIPALHSLNCEGLLNKETRLIGVARSRLTDDSFRQKLYQGVLEYSRFKSNRRYICSLWPEFAERIAYRVCGYHDPESYRELARHLEGLKPAVQGNCLFYLATPPHLFPEIVDRIGAEGLDWDETGWRRIVIEKPFGRDLRSAQDLNRQIRSCFTEDRVFRIDHYLGKETVQNILTFRFANAIFEPLWSRNYVDHIQIIVSEADGVVQRGPYYDQTGVIRDMMQNHLLQLLSLTAMEPPAILNDRELRNEKIKVLQSMRKPDLNDIVLGQYRGYSEEPGVAEGSITPTYAAIRLFVDNWRWQGVPFYLCTGKRLQDRATEISMQFKSVPHLLFPDTVHIPRNHISLCIQPNEGIHLGFEIKLPGAGMRSEPVDMAFHHCKRFGKQVLPDAYERLLIDALQGDTSLFTRADEIESAWGLLDPLIRSTEGEQIRPFLYDPGASGPVEADEMLRRDGRSWHRSCKGSDECNADTAGQDIVIGSEPVADALQPKS